MEHNSAWIVISYASLQCPGVNVRCIVWWSNGLTDGHSNSSWAIAIGQGGESYSKFSFGPRELDVVGVREFRWMALCPKEKHFYRLGRI